MSYSKRILIWIVAGYSLFFTLVVGLIYTTDFKISLAGRIFAILLVAGVFASLVLVRRIIVYLRNGERAQHDFDENRQINIENDAVKRAIIRELDVSQQRIFEIMRYAPIGMAVANDKGQLTLVNEALCSFLGYSKEELERLSVVEITHPDDRKTTAAYLETLLYSEQSIYQGERRYLCKDGHVVWGRLSVTIHRDISGAMSYIALIENISDRKQLEDILREREALYLAVLETSADGFWITDMSGRFLEVNNAYLRRSGYSREELLNMNISDMEVKEKPDETAVHIEKLKKDGHDRFESLHKTKSGETWPVEIVVNFWPIGEGRIFGFVADITARKKATDELRLMAKVFQNSVEAIVITDSENNIININPSFTKLTGYIIEEIIGKNPNILSTHSQPREFYEEMWRCILNEGSWQGEILDRRKDGSIYPKWLSISTVHNSYNEIVNFVASFTDITERKKAENEIKQLAFHDTLTGLNNRYSLITQMEQVLLKSKRDQSRFIIMFIDLDRFKVINDTLGHRIGDRLLVQVAERLRSSTRESDMVARLGGDEFVVLISDLSKSGTAVFIAEKIILHISKSYQIEGHDLYTSPSIGISLYPEDGKDVTTLMKCADTAMYQAKSEGGNNFKFFARQMNQHAEERLKLENGLHRALKNHEFDLYYQPQVSLDGGIYCVEALLRWNHPELGLQMPDSFIPIAEETGMILPMGLWVLETACHQLSQWINEGLPIMRVGVNLSSSEFLQENFSETVAKIIEDAGLSPAQVELEITESTAMANPEKIIKVMHSLKEAKIRLSIDDFGTGYSSLTYLGRLPIDQLKIDKSFIQDMQNDATILAIVMSTIELAQKICFEVVAEGVANESQSQILIQHGCDFQQGYYFSKPLPADEFKAFLIKRKS